MEAVARLPLEKQSEALQGLLQTRDDERDADAERKAKVRSKRARITIPECKNPQRREKCLADPERFLKTYFADRYTLPFGKDHLFMIDTIVSRAKHGGRQAVAAPRGRGKSELVKGLLVYIVLAELVRFPLPVAATTTLASRVYQDFKKKLATNELLLDDYPEVCYPIRALQGTPQRAGRQHVDGALTEIVWKSDYISLPHVPWDANEYLRSLGDAQPRYGGVKMAYYGLDAAFRGANIDSDRPDFVLVDDPETRESSKSAMQSEDRETILDQDISGLASQEENLAIVVLTTVQNKTPCLSYRLTDRTLKPAYNGRRFGMVVTWPDNMDLWEKYVELRRDAQVAGDVDAEEAVDFYLENRDRMDAGVEMLSDHYVESVKDGRPLVYSAIQQAFNRIADTSREAYETEYQNDPPEESGPQGLGLTAELVANRLSGLGRRQLPANTATLTAAIDLGKYACHWVVCAWWKGAGGCVVDYGVAEVKGTNRAIDDAASEPHVYRALLAWRDELLQTTYVDAAGAERKLDAVFVDSGDYTNSAYEFVRQVGAPFYAIKGVGNYRSKQPVPNKIRPGDHMDATYQPAAKVWLFNLSVDYWKNWVHERFLTPAFDENNMLRHGSLSLFALEGRQQHTAFAHHIVAEELVSEFTEGKGTKTYWHAHNKNNHWLDATTYAAAAARYQGISLLTPVEVANKPRDKSEVEKKKTVAKNRRPHGPANLNRRAGGWMQSIRKKGP